MSLRFLDSFDHYTTLTQKYTSSATGTITSAAARTGIAGCRLDSGNTGPTKTFDAQAQWIVGCAFRTSNLAVADGVVATRDGTTLQGYWRTNADGTLSILRGDGTVLATSTLTIQVNVFYYIEFKHIIANAGGTMELRVNGVVYATFTGDTQNSANATADQIRFRTDLVGGGNLDIDDVYVLDGQGSVNNYLGDLQIEILLPNGAGNYSQWTPSAGSNFQNVDEAAPDDDTTYNSEATEGEADTYTYGNLSVAAGTIHAIQIGIRARKESAGTANIQRRYRRGSDNDGASFNPSESYAYQLEILETDPIAAGAWTVTNINAAEFGVEAVA